MLLPRIKPKILLLSLLSLLLLATATFLNWNLTKHLVQYSAYKTISTFQQTLMENGVEVDTSWSGQSSFIKAHIAAHRELWRETYEDYIVDVGAHDGTWLSNSRPFLNVGYAGLLIEANKNNFEKLKKNTKSLAANIHIKNLLIGRKDGGFYKFDDTRGWWDGTEGRLIGRCTFEAAEVNCLERNSLPTLLNEVKAPKNFMILSIDIEKNAKFYSFLVNQIFAKGGYRPRYIIVEMDKDATHEAFVKLGYVSIGRFKFDEVFYLEETR